MVLHCTNRSIREKTNEAIRLGNSRYPTTIQAVSALLTAAARDKKKRNNQNKKTKKKWNHNKKNNDDRSKSN